MYVVLIKYYRGLHGPDKQQYKENKSRHQIFML